MRIFVSAPDIFPGDAVGNHCLSIVRSARRLGWDAQAYAQRFSGDVFPMDRLFEEISVEDTLLVSYSIYDPLLERLQALPGRKLCYFHGVTPAELLQEFEPVTAESCAKSVAQFPLLKRFDLLIVNSRFTAQTLEQHLRMDDVRIIPPVAADMPIFKSDPTECENASDGLNLLVVGRVVPHKRLEDAIDILADLRRCGQDARLSIVGDAPNENYLSFLEQSARQKEIYEYVEFTGVLDDSALQSCFRRSSLLLSVSRHEGFCVPVLEAMHMGLPVFVRSGTAASEVAGSAAVEFSCLEDICTSIINMYTNSDLEAGMVQAGKRRAKEVLELASDAVFQSVFAVSRAVWQDA